MLKRVVLSTILLFTSISAENFDNYTSFQGYTGIMNIPNANVLDYGKAEVSFSNQVSYFDNLKREDYKALDYFLNIGILPYLEVGGRVSEVYPKKGGKYYLRDLSANVKFQLPFYDDLPSYIPRVAIGVQDIGGAASYYDSKYIVMTNRIYFLQNTLGYGFKSQRLDGLFFGVEAKINDWAYLLAEYDSKESHIGLRVNTPNNFFKYGNIAFFAKKNLTYKEADYTFGLNFKFNIGKKYHYKDKINNIAIENNINNYKKEKVFKSNKNKIEKIKTIDDLKKRLVDFGFENIDIGESKDRIYVAYENNIMDYNELDALGVVIGYISFLEKYKYFEIVVKKSNIKIKKLEGDLFLYRKFLKEPSLNSTMMFKKSLKLSTDFNTNRYNMKIINASSSYFKTRVDFSPALTTFVATDYGVFDYIAYLRTHIHWNLYKGLDFGVIYDIPALHSDELDKESGRYRNYNKGAGIESIMLHKSNIFGNFINTISIGSYKRDYLGAINQSSYSFDNNQIKLKIGSFKNSKIDNEERKNILLASYQYYINPFDSLIEIRGGKYFYQDSGYDVKFKKYFGDRAIYLFYQNTTSNQYAGIGIEIPLTFRKYNRAKYLQIKGTNNFNYYLRTTINRDDNTNKIVPSGAEIPKGKFEIGSYFLNRDRLQESYIKSHILRFRDVYNQYILKNID